MHNKEKNKKSKVELLCPAGSTNAAHAAVSGGADAIYLGMSEFNARRGAENFCLDELRNVVRYAHLRDVKVYLTLNIAVFESELARVIKTAKNAADAGADAFIVQDIGVCRELVKTVLPSHPSVGIHISTQMNIHSTKGLEFAARLGADRVTLSRELSLGEISTLSRAAKNLGMEIEVFGHGALCVSYSGQCLMSSMIGGRSANRGTCAQACRLEYELEDATSSNYANQTKKSAKNKAESKRYLLSPKDLCSIDMMPALQQAGIASLKIEGRMKSPEYVYAVASQYRKALDSLADSDNFDKDAAKKKLAQAFSRGFTTAYLTGDRDNKIMGYTRPNNRGVKVGRVRSVSRTGTKIDTSQKTNSGDILEIWTSKGRATIRVDKNCKVTRDSIEAKIDMSTGELRGVRKGDRVFRVRSAANAFVDNELEPKVAVEGKITLKIGHPLTLVLIHSQRQNLRIKIIGDVVEEARTRVVSASDVKKHICRTGQTPFEICKLDIELDENVGIGFSALHHIRSEALQQLEEVMLEC